MEKRRWHAHYDPEVPTSIEYPEVPLTYFLERSAHKYPHRPCTIFKGATITYREMVALTDRLAAGLVELGISKGDRVGILMPNTPEFVIAYFGILKAGGVVVATNPMYTGREIQYQVDDSGMTMMMVDNNYYQQVKKVQAETELHRLIVTSIKETLPPPRSKKKTSSAEKQSADRGKLEDDDLWMADLLASHRPEDIAELEIRPDDRAIFQYSGGTTGTPKAAIGLHRNLVANTLQLSRWISVAVEGEAVVLMAIPLYHVYGMVCGMNFALAKAAALVMVPDARDVEDLANNVEKYRATIFPGVPALFSAINNHPTVQAGRYDLSSIKACISGSAPLMRKTKETFETLTGGVVFEGYGLSEAPTATHCNPLKGQNRIGSIGLPFPDVDAKIIDLEDEKTELAVGEIGELVIKAPQVFWGYHKMPGETSNTLRDGWLYTGDIARMDDDGYFYLVDRKKEVIKPGGFQVWPREVEEVLQEHPTVREAGVAGVPDTDRGEIVKAWVVLLEGQQVTAAELQDWCGEKLAKYKIPTEIEFRQKLPKTHVGKLLRRELVRDHIENRSGS